MTNYSHPQTRDSRLWLFDDTSSDISDPVPNDMGWDVDVDEDGPFITSSFDDYCDAHPDFNAALNGHWEYI